MTKTIKQLFPKPPWLATSYRHKCPIHDCFPTEVEQFGDSVQPILIVIMCASGPGVIYCENKASSDPRMNSGCLAEVSFPIPSFILVSHSSNNFKRFKIPDEKVFYPPGNKKLTNITHRSRVSWENHPLNWGLGASATSGAMLGGEVADGNFTHPKSVLVGRGHFHKILPK